MSEIKRKIEDFNKRWDIVTEGNYQEEFNKYKTRVLNILREVDEHVEDEGIVKFCNLIGKPVEWKHTSQQRYSLNIIEAFNNETKEYEFYRLIEYLFIIKFKTPNSFLCNINSYTENYFNLIKEAIDYSIVNVNIAINGDEVILYPRGEEKLDDVLVNEILSFLNKECNKHFSSALKLYENGSAVKSAEGLRRALEEFLKFKLQNDRGLDANISELQKKLKGDKRDPQVRNIIFATLNYLDTYFNENSKHKDGDIDETENEYLIYQIGVLMRYVNKIV